MNKKLMMSVLTLLLFFGLSIGSSFAAVVGLRGVDLTPNLQGQIEVPVSSVFEVELFFDGLDEYSDAVNSEGGLTGFLVDIQWDPLIEFVSAEGDSRLGGSGGFFTATPVPDQPIPNLVEIGGTVGQQYDPFTEDFIVLSTLTLQCVAPGLTTLTTTPHFSFGFNWSLESGLTLDEAGLNYEGIAINQVPIPSAILLLGGGLIGLVGLRRRKIS